MAKDSKRLQHNSLGREKMQSTRALTKPTKQRKILFQAPAHKRHKLLAAHFSAELRTSHATKSFPVRTGDTVRVVRGDHKGVEGKITSVNLTKYRIFVEGLTREKVDGTTINVPIHPSKVIVTRLNLDDKWRKEILESRKEAHRKLEKAEKMPKAKPVEERVEIEEVTKPEAEEITEKKPVVKEKAPKKRVTKKTPAKKKAAKKTEPEADKAKKEKPQPKKPTKRTSRKSVKKTEEGDD
jgi:large subunit ribosomal protein L24